MIISGVAATSVLKKASACSLSGCLTSIHLIGNGFSPDEYQRFVPDSSLTVFFSPPYQHTSASCHACMVSVASCFSDAERSPFSRCLPLWPLAGEDGCSYKAASSLKRETRVTFRFLQACPKRMQAKPPSPIKIKECFSQREMTRTAMIVQSMLVLCFLPRASSYRLEVASIVINGSAHGRSHQGSGTISIRQTHFKP